MSDGPTVAGIIKRQRPGLSLVEQSPQYRQLDDAGGNEGLVTAHVNRPRSISRCACNGIGPRMSLCSLLQRTRKPSGAEAGTGASLPRASSTQSTSASTSVVPVASPCFSWPEAHPASRHGTINATIAAAQAPAARTGAPITSRTRTRRPPRWRHSRRYLPPGPCPRTTLRRWEPKSASTKRRDCSIRQRCGQARHDPARRQRPAA